MANRSSSEKICVVVPDATRPLPFEKVLAPLLNRLQAGGNSLCIVVGLGLHRPMNAEELAPIRRAIGDLDIELVQHDVRASDLVDLGSIDEIPIALNRRVVQADHVVCVGTVEPHQYAGFSGGIKAISIGCASEATISAMHGLTFLRDERTALGRIEGNPFQEALWAIGQSINDAIGMQVVPAIGGGVADIVVDEIRPAFLRACEIAGSLFFQEFDAPVDWLHLPVPDVKASNFYQASRSATYVALVDRPAIRRGGTILLEAACPEGLGTGAGERACGAAMLRGRDKLLEDLESGGVQTRGGEQRAYVLAQTCERNRVALIGAPPMDELSAMGIEQFESLDEARSELGLEDSAGVRIDDVFHRIPRLR